MDHDLDREPAVALAVPFLGEQTAIFWNSTRLRSGANTGEVATASHSRCTTRDPFRGDDLFSVSSCHPYSVVKYLDPAIGVVIAK